VVSLTSITLLIAPLARHAETRSEAQGSKADGMRAWRRGDHEAAMNVLGPFADAGEPDAQNAVGEMLLQGNTGVPRNEAAAAAWFRKAAFQGYARAQVNLGTILERHANIAGTAGIRAFGNAGNAGKEEAARWYRRAAIQGFAPGQHHLARLYETGEGVMRNIGLAVFWYTKAVNRNYAPSQFAMGLLRHDGIGLSRNLADARRWYQKAADQGLPEAIEALEEVSRAEAR
jgi:TPR repeat protein